MNLVCDRRLVTGYLRLSDNLAMMMRVCILPQEVSSSRTRSKTATAWFADRHMQELLVLVYDELSARKPSSAEKPQTPVFKRGDGFRAALYFSRHGYIQHLVIPNEKIKLLTTTSPQGHTKSGHSFRLHPEAVYAVVDDLEVPSNGGVAKLLSEKGGTKDITAYFTCLSNHEEDKENILPMLSIDRQQHRKPSKAKKTKVGRASVSTTSTDHHTTKNQPLAISSHQLKIDTLLNKQDTNIHVVKLQTTSTTSTACKTDILSSDGAASPDASDSGRPCHEQSCHANNTNNDILDCLFDDIDYHDLFDSKPLPSVTEDRLDDIMTPRQQHEGSCDHDMSCDTGVIDDDTIIEIPESDDEDVTNMSTASCTSSTSTISFDDVVMIERDGKNHELSRRTIFRNTKSIKDLTNKQIGRWMVFRKYFIRDIMAGKVSCERHNKYIESNNARRVIRNESFLIMAFSRDQLDYIIDHLKKLFDLDGLLNYDYVMSVLLIEVCIHIIMDLHQVDYRSLNTFNRVLIWEFSTLFSIMDSCYDPWCYKPRRH